MKALIIILGLGLLDGASVQAVDEFKTVVIPGTTVSIDLVKVPASDAVKSHWVMKTEVTWDMYDVFLLRLDLPDVEREKEIDLKIRPSKPYWLPDEGFGHAGHPALAINYNGGIKFALWLSGKTGLKFRLPSEDEWEYACKAGSDKAGGALDGVAWHDDNSDGMTAKVATKKPNIFGLYDMRGNVSEWVMGRDGKMVIKGGSFWDYPEDVHCEFREIYTADWNTSDPQFPKSEWWMADAPFAGFRLIMDD